MRCHRFRKAAGGNGREERREEQESSGAPISTGQISFATEVPQRAWCKFAFQHFWYLWGSHFIEAFRFIFVHKVVDMRWVATMLYTANVNLGSNHNIATIMYTTLCTLV